MATEIFDNRVTLIPLVELDGPSEDLPVGCRVTIGVDEFIVIERSGQRYLRRVLVGQRPPYLS